MSDRDELADDITALNANWSPAAHRQEIERTIPKVPERDREALARAKALAEIIDDAMDTSVRAHGQIPNWRWDGPLNAADAVRRAGYAKPPLEQLRRQHLDHAAIREALERADGEWDEETGDGPANPLYLDQLTAAVTAKWNQA